MTTETTQANRTALVVEDDDFMREEYATILEDKGYQVSSAIEMDKLKQYAKREFDLAIIDGLEGRCFDAYDIIKAKRKMIITGSDRLFEEAKNRGIEAYDKGDIEFLGVLKKI